MAKIITLSVFCLFITADSAQAKKWNFSYNKGSSKQIRVMSSFITSSKNVKTASRRSSRVRQGDRIYFYYKIGPLKVKQGRGAPYKTRLMIKRGRRMIKDFGWHSSNAAAPNQRNKDITYKHFHNAKWYLIISNSLRPGSYTAIINHVDQNSGKTLTIRYHFSVAR